MRTSTRRADGLPSCSTCSEAYLAGPNPGAPATLTYLALAGAAVSTRTTRSAIDLASSGIAPLSCALHGSRSRRAAGGGQRIGPPHDRGRPRGDRAERSALLRGVGRGRALVP